MSFVYTVTGIAYRFQYAIDPPVAAAGVEATTRQFSSDFHVHAHSA